MAVNSKLRSGDRVPAGSPALIPCLLGTCPGGSSGSPGNSYAVDPGADVVGALGAGSLAQLVLYLHATTGSRVVVSPTVGTYPALPAVTKTGTGPSVTVGLTPGNTLGAYDTMPILATVKVAGVGGVGQIGIAYDGVDEAEVRVIPAEGPAALRAASDHPITPSTLALVSTLTLVFTAPAAKTLTIPVGSLAASAAGLKAATATIAAPHTYTASDLLTAGKAALLANPRRIRYTTSGADPTHVPATIDVTGTDYTGATQTETVVPSTSAGSVSTTKAYATIASEVYATAGGTDALIAQGYEDAYASVAELVVEINTLALASPLAIVATDAETTAGAFLQLATTAAGTSVSITIDDATSTGEALLGFSTAASNLTASGTAATLDLPFTGVTLTFPSGTYPLAGTYSIPLVGPRSSVSALSAAATAARDNYHTNPFGLLVTVEDFSTMANAATALAALNALRATWNADPAAPIFVDALVSTALHTASATASTNATNVATSDAAFIAAFPASTPDSVFCSVAVDDVYIPGAGGLPAGTYRRPASWAGASKVAGANKIAMNPADGGVFGATLQGPSGALARNESTAATKLGGLGGPGAWVLKSTSQGLAAPAFEVCATRAGASSRLRDPGALRIGLELMRLVFGEVEVWNGQTWEGDATNPIAADVSETSSRADHLHQLLGRTARPADFAPSGAHANAAAPPNVTAFDVTVSAPTLGNDGKVAVALTYNPLGVVGIVNVNVTATGAAITSGG